MFEKEIVQSVAKVSDRRMSPRESELLIAELKTWCNERYGRRAEVAEAIGVSRQIVSDWLAGRSVPSLDNGLKLLRFLKKQRRQK